MCRPYETTAVIAGILHVRLNSHVVAYSTYKWPAEYMGLHMQPYQIIGQWSLHETVVHLVNTSSHNHISTIITRTNMFGWATKTNINVIENYF